ncbi:gasdermin-E-like [Polyodon spathula]|uniref:gasdermin-E-like n=1 Tax=Polyodon spathula TaxID=7913 RepID=UPI001B7EFE1A|nr:gasdermin-E-like [Polyodon spathula]
MFAKATSSFVKQIDSDGELIPVARLNDSDKLQPLCLVIKRKRFWFWQKPKYISSPFSLSDVLIGDNPIEPVVVESAFLNYESTFGDIIGGHVETEVGNLSLSMEGKGSSKLQSSFGDLRKQEVDVLHLLQHSEERVINMDHPFVQQTRERPNEVFGVLKEKIITTQKCLISEQVQEEGQCGSMLGLRAKRIKVSVQENGNMQKDSSVVLEIPPETVLAYSIIELSVKTNGQYDLCLLPDKRGGFEAETSKKPISPDLQSLVDGPMDGMIEPDGGRVQRNHSEDVRNIPSEAPLAVLKQDLEEFKTQFKPFAEMPEDERSALFKMVNKVLRDSAVLIVVENMLEQLSSGAKPDLAELEELNPSQKACATSLLQAIGYSCEESQLMETDSLHRAPCLLTATHFLISAMEEMSDISLAELASCCDLQIIQALCSLLSSITAEGNSSLKTPLIEEKKFHIAEHLFALSDINLQKDQSAVRATTGKQPGFLPLILCIAVSGLATLSESH